MAKGWENNKDNFDVVKGKIRVEVMSELMVKFGEKNPKANMMPT